jgi:hypothetical protein
VKSEFVRARSAKSLGVPCIRLDFQETLKGRVNARPWDVTVRRGDERCGLRADTTQPRSLRRAALMRARCAAFDLIWRASLGFT